MKVLQIINSLYTGGAEKLLVETLPMYKKYGVDVDLLLLDATVTPFYEKLKENFEGRVFVSSVNNIYSPKQIFEIRRFVKKDYDILQVHLFPCLYWVALLKFFWRLDNKLMFTEHSTDNRRLKNFFFRQMDKLIYKQYDKIIAITPQVKKVLIQKLKIPSKKVEVIYNGIDVKTYNIAEGYNKTVFFDDDDDSIILIQVSRFEIQKDQKTIIKAMSLLPNKYKLLLIGEGSLKKECEKLVDEMELEERVLFLGIRMDVAELLKTADIVIQSSHWEGFGLAAVEGMAARKPVVVSNVEGLADIVKDAGLLFPKGNEKELAKIIIELGDNYKYAEYVATKCYERAQNYDIKALVENFVDLYDKVNMQNK